MVQLAVCVRQAFTAWAREHQLTAWNIVHRSMRNKITCPPKATDMIFKVVHKVSWTNWKSCLTLGCEEALPCQEVCLETKEAAKKQSREQKQQSKKARGLKNCYHAANVLSQVLMRPGVFPRSGAPQKVVNQWPEKSYLKFASVPEGSKLAFVAAFILSARSPSERAPLLKKVVARKVAKKSSVSKVHVALAAARGAWTPALVKLLDNTGRRGHK